MKITMIRCDNPSCHNTEHPEEGGTTKNPRPPYGWVYAKGGCYGSGPFFDVVVCDTACLEPAVDHAIQEAISDERGD